MATYNVQGTSLTAVADAIRAKSGGSESLEFPDGFVSELENMPPKYTINEAFTFGFPAISGDVVYNGASLPPFAFTGNTGITSFTSHTINYLYGNNSLAHPYRQYSGSLSNPHTFAECINLVSINIPNLTTLAYCDCSFKNCSKLKNWGIPFENLKSLGAGTFEGCTFLPSLVLKNFDDPVYANLFKNCTSLEYIDFANDNLSASRRIQGNAFIGASKLSVLIFRDSSKMFTLDNVNAFTNTPFASNGSGGILYVSSLLKSTYESATNWSVILGYSNNQIKTIEGSIYETQYADGTPITTS